MRTRRVPGRNLSSVRCLALETTRPGCRGTSRAQGPRGGPAFVEDVASGAAKEPGRAIGPTPGVERTLGSHSPPVGGHGHSLSAALADRAPTTVRERWTTATTTHTYSPVRAGKIRRASSSSFHVKHEVMSPRHGPLRLGSAGVGSGWRDDRPPPSCRRPRWGVSGWPHHRSTQVLTSRRGLVTWVLVPIRARSRGFHATSEAEEGYRAL